MMIKYAGLAIFMLLIPVVAPPNAYAGDRMKAQVHFEPFEFSIPEKNDFVYFTLFIVPEKQSNLLDLCKMEPRVRDVVNKTFHGFKGLASLGQDNRYIAKASPALKERINKAVGGNWVYEAIFVRGAIDLETGPLENPTVPNPLSCKQIYFQAKSSRDPDAE